MKLTEFLEEHGVKWWEHGEHHHVTANFIGTDCPFCTPNTNRARMGFKVNTGVCVCYSCGPQNRIEALSLLTGLSKGQVWKIFGGIDFDRLLEFKRAGKLVLPDGLGPLLKNHVRYLKGRGFDRKVVKLWQLQGLDRTAGRYAHRVFIPVYYRGTLVSWTTRATSDDVVSRYLSAPSDAEMLPSKTLLYGEDYCGNSIIVHEGPLDVWKVGPGAVCTLGVNFTRAQVSKMAKYTRRVVCFDNEPGAQRRAKRLCDHLAPFPGETMNVLLDAKDPGEASEKEIRKLRRLL
jgi:hypothetical protein